MRNKYELNVILKRRFFLYKISYFNIYQEKKNLKMHQNKVEFYNFPQIPSETSYTNVHCGVVFVVVQVVKYD